MAEFVNPGTPRNPAPLCQLHEPTKDGNPLENSQQNCGETALAWVVRDIGTEADCDGDELHDEVVGQGVIGGSDLLDPANAGALNPKYVAAAHKRGVELTLVRGTQAQLVAAARAALQTHPACDVLANFGGGAQYLHAFADPAHYSGEGHICAIAKYETGSLTLMDPWIGGWRTYSDTALEQMVVWGYLVVATPLAPAPVAPPPPPPAPTPDQRIAALSAQLASATASIATLTSQRDALSAQLATLQAKVAAAKSALA